MYFVLTIGSISLFLYLFNNKRYDSVMSLLKCYTYLENKYNSLLTNKETKYSLEEIKNYKDDETNYYILNYYIKNRHLYQIINFEDSSIENLFSIVNNKTQIINYLQFTSPIISCCLIAGEEQINYTDIINRFVNYNSNIILSNTGKNKLLWLYLLKKYMNIEIDENTKISWKIILDDVSIYDGDIININIDNGKIKVI